MKNPNSTFLAVVGAWGLAAAAAGAAGLLVRLPVPVLPIAVFGSALILVAGLPRGRWLNAALASLGPRGILALNLGRFVGVAFLWMNAQGRLPEAFAERAGWGDVATAAAAAVLLFWRDGPAFRRALVVWNLFGLLDLIVAVGTAASLAVRIPGSMGALATLPFCLIPFWIVPILLAMHIYLLGVAFKGRAGAGGSAQGSAPA